LDGTTVLLLIEMLDARFACLWGEDKGDERMEGNTNEVSSDPSRVEKQR
jgi:hypothetical protein